MTAAVITRPTSALVRALPIRAVVLIAAVVAAYHYSLISLARGLTLQTPLAYLGLVPVIALGLGWYWAVRRPAVGPYDLRLDFTLGRLLGLALVLAALLIGVIVPMTSGLDFWLLRVDLLSLPIFVAGIIALLFGVRQLWNVRFAVLFLFLAWPVPYLAILADGMTVSVDATVAVLSVIAAIVPLATQIGGSDGLFMIGRGDDTIPVAIASACSGANSVVGFALVGVALFAILRGPIRRRLAWLVAGIVLTWLLNVIRIEMIFLVGAIATPQLALNVLHPIAGIVVFNIGLVVMLLVAGRFGLEVRLGDRPPAVERTDAVTPRHGRLAAGAAVVAATLALGLVNATYAGFQPLGGDQGLPAISGFQPGRAWVPDWASRQLADYTHGRQFFGEDSTWTRSVYSPLASATMRANVPVYLDVINTGDAATLAGYSVESCYSFHGYVVESAQRVELTAGLDASLRSYADPRGSTDWTILTWEWPVQHEGSLRYERIVVLLPDGDIGTFQGLPAVDLAGTAERFGDAERLLVTLARTMVANQLASEAAAG
jgi:exosortase/archaeosortase family protein